MKNSRPCRDLNPGPPRYQADMPPTELSWLGYYCLVNVDVDVNVNVNVNVIVIVNVNITGQRKAVPPISSSFLLFNISIFSSPAIFEL